MLAFPVIKIKYPGWTNFNPLTPSHQKQLEHILTIPITKNLVTELFKICPFNIIIAQCE